MASVAKKKLIGVSRKSRLHLCEEMRTLKQGQWGWGRGGVPFQAEADNDQDHFLLLQQVPAQGC